MSDTLERIEPLITPSLDPSQGPHAEPVIYELGAPGRTGYALPELGVPACVSTSAAVSSASPRIA